jgi:hypothetical protein
MGMARRVSELLNDAGLRARMGNEGRRRAPEFGAAKMVAEIDAHYQSLIELKLRG